MSADPTLADAWYVYSVLPADAGVPATPAILPGVTIAALHSQGLTALVSLVPRALFDRASPTQRTADPEWMAERVAAHHAVNVAATAAGPCLPLAFGVLFSQPEGLVTWLDTRGAALRAALKQVAGQSEWALSLQQDAARTAAWLEQTDPTLQALAASAAGAGEGTAFLMTKRRDKARAVAARAAIESQSAVIVDRLTSCGFRMLPDSPAAGMPAWTIITQTRSRVRSKPLADVVAALGADLAPTGLSLRLTGPWPNYAFARTALAEEARYG